MQQSLPLSMPACLSLMQQARIGGAMMTCVTREDVFTGQNMAAVRALQAGAVPSLPN